MKTAVVCVHTIKLPLLWVIDLPLCARTMSEDREKAQRRAWFMEAGETASTRTSYSLAHSMLLWGEGNQTSYDPSIIQISVTGLKALASLSSYPYTVQTVGITTNPVCPHLAETDRIKYPTTYCARGGNDQGPHDLIQLLFIRAIIW